MPRLRRSFLWADAHPGFTPRPVIWHAFSVNANCWQSKVVADEIDKVLAKHYGFTEEELDFIINYDIKYRMGDELGGEEE